MGKEQAWQIPTVRPTRPVRQSAPTQAVTNSAQAEVDDQGVFQRFFEKTEDDAGPTVTDVFNVITSGGYRIGPAEIEDCLLTHPAVATVGVVGKPDPLRTEIVKAYVVAKPDVPVTAGELQDWVKDRLASYSYPREITFLDELPMTVTGKPQKFVMRDAMVAELEAVPGE